MRFGADYYPEHWPRERWETDARLMAEAGLEVVRLAEFAWSRLEPEQGRFDFAWLDEALQVLGRAGLKAVLGTPSAALRRGSSSDTRWPCLYAKTARAWASAAATTIASRTPTTAPASPR